ncbi:MAG: hypothetical protein IMW89_22260, partial [Ktedonobacteraceae bacterium]|nr:hypothetical protein [Ktedonobacteraceae bacterium]
MPDRITLNEDKETVLASAPSIPLYIHFARYVSTILSPSVISVPFIILVALYRASSTIVALGYALITLFFLSAGPLLYIAAGVRAGKFTDMDVSMRSQRL